MAYKQSNNPISRKTSPINKVNPPRLNENTAGIISEDELDLTGNTSASASNQPSPKLTSGDRSLEPGDKDYEATNKTAVEAGVVSGKGRQGTNRDERKARRQERRNIRKDKDLSRSQKTMAKKESRIKQRENIRGVKDPSPVNFMGIKRPGRCTPFPNPDCEPGTPQYNLAKRLKPGGDLYKGKKK
jgi:hypothetical protein